MEKPFLVLDQKQWLTGVSGASNSGIGGIFKQAVGVSAIRGIGTWNNDDIGLLQAGPSGTAITVSDTIIATAKEPTASALATNMWMLGSSGHIYKLTAGEPATIVDYGGTSQITNPANGLAILRPAGGTQYLYYFQKSQIGRIATTIATNRMTGWAEDAYYTTNIENIDIHPTHNFLDGIFFGNDYYIGSIRDNGAADVTITPRALDVPQNYRVIALEDDGFYLVASITSDISYTGQNVGSKIIFWDTYSSSWQREWTLNDTIKGLKRVGGVLYGTGKRGIYEISYSGGIRKIWQKGAQNADRKYAPTILSSFGNALVYGGNWATDAHAVSVLGKPDPVLPYAYHTPIDSGLTSTNYVNFVDSEFMDGIIFIGGTDNSLQQCYFAYTAGQQDTGVTAETVRIPLASPRKLKRVDVVLGAQLATGDSLTVQVFKNDLTTFQTVGTVSYTTHGAKRRVVLTNFPEVLCEEVVLKLTFGGGAVKVKRVEFYGDLYEPQTA